MPYALLVTEDNNLKQVAVGIQCTDTAYVSRMQSGLQKSKRKEEKEGC